MEELSRALVTGGTSGIGRSCADLLLRSSAQVTVVGRDLSKIEGAGFDGIACDLSDDKSLAELIAALRTRGGKIAGWVLAAGVQEIRPLSMETPESLARTFRLNVTGSLGLIGAALKARLVEPGGSIVFVSSAATHAGGPGMVSYAASKGALEAAVKSLALELAGQKIRVNAVAPGVVETPMSSKYMGKLTDAQRQALEAAHPLGFGQPEDVAAPIAFLLSNAARWITGTVMLVDGGLCCR